MGHPTMAAMLPRTSSEVLTMPQFGIARRKPAQNALWLLVFRAVFLIAWPAHAEPKFPALTGRVVDAANVLPPPVKVQLDQKLAALEARTGDQLLVATVPDLQGYEISDYGYRLGRTWGLGQRNLNNGVILLVAPKERRVRVEVGYGR